MIILKGILCKYLQSVQVELPRAHMKIDPRPNRYDSDSLHEPFHEPKFQCDYHANGTTVTITSLESQPPDDVDDEIYSFRAYDPTTETVPPFDSTTYEYQGQDDERAPRNTTSLHIHSSVTVIKEYAFLECDKIKKCFMHDGVHTIEEMAFAWCDAMKVIRLSQSLTHIGEYAFSNCENITKCIMHDGVHTIEEGAFAGCYEMKTIRLSRSLTHIGKYAFSGCSSLQALFLPPTVNQIDEYAFVNCKNLRILSLPPNIDISQMGEGMLEGCDDFFVTTEIQHYDEDDNQDEEDDNDRVHQEIIDFYRDRVPPLHKVCMDTNVTRQTIQQCINTHGQATVSSFTDHDGMTPLHILVMNPHADISALRACFELNKSVAFLPDRWGETPLDYLKVHRDSIDDHTSLVTSLLGLGP